MNHRRFAVCLEARVPKNTTVYLTPLVMHGLSGLGHPALYGPGSGQVRSCAPSYDLSSGQVRSSVKMYDLRSGRGRLVRSDLTWQRPWKEREVEIAVGFVRTGYIYIR